MKKIMLIIFLFIININPVLAESSAYLTALSIEGYELSPNFDKYNNTYSLDVDEDVTALNINYKLEDENAQVQILGNDSLTEEEQTVTINVTNGQEKQTYIIYVTKEQTQKAANVINDELELNIPRKYNNKLIIILLGIIWLLLILITKEILFKKKKVG